MKAPRQKTRHASDSYRLYVHRVWPTKYRKHVLGEKLTPVFRERQEGVLQAGELGLVVDIFHVRIYHKTGERRVSTVILES